MFTCQSFCASQQPVLIHLWLPVLSEDELDLILLWVKRTEEDLLDSVTFLVWFDSWSIWSWSIHQLRELQCWLIYQLVVKRIQEWTYLFVEWKYKCFELFFGNISLFYEFKFCNFFICFICYRWKKVPSLNICHFRIWITFEVSHDNHWSNFIPVKSDSSCFNWFIIFRRAKFIPDLCLHWFKVFFRKKLCLNQNTISRLFIRLKNENLSFWIKINIFCVDAIFSLWVICTNHICSVIKERNCHIIFR